MSEDKTLSERARRLEQKYKRRGDDPGSELEGWGWYCPPGQSCYYGAPPCSLGPEPTSWITNRLDSGTMSVFYPVGYPWARVSFYKANWYYLFFNDLNTQTWQAELKLSSSCNGINWAERETLYVNYGSGTEFTIWYDSTNNIVYLAYHTYSPSKWKVKWGTPSGGIITWQGEGETGWTSGYFESICKVPSGRLFALLSSGGGGASRAYAKYSDDGVNWYPSGTGLLLPGASVESYGYTVVPLTSTYAYFLCRKTTSPLAFGRYWDGSDLGSIENTGMSPTACGLQDLDGNIHAWRTYLDSIFHVVRGAGLSGTWGNVLEVRDTNDGDPLIATIRKDPIRMYYQDYGISNDAIFHRDEVPADCYLYKDKGTIGPDFIHKVDIFYNATGDMNPFYTCFWGLSKEINPADDWSNAYMALARQENTLFSIFLEEIVNGTLNVSNTIPINNASWYYPTITKSGSSLVLDLYSDSGRTILVNSCILNLIDPSATFQYVYALSSFLQGTKITIEVMNLILSGTTVEDYWTYTEIDPNPVEGTIFMWGAGGAYEPTTLYYKEWNSTIQQWGPQVTVGQLDPNIDEWIFDALMCPYELLSNGKHFLAWSTDSVPSGYCFVRTGRGGLVQ